MVPARVGDVDDDLVGAAPLHLEVAVPAWSDGGLDAGLAGEPGALSRVELLAGLVEIVHLETEVVDAVVVGAVSAHVGVLLGLVVQDGQVDVAVGEEDGAARAAADLLEAEGGSVEGGHLVGVRGGQCDVFDPCHDRLLLAAGTQGWTVGQIVYSREAHGGSMMNRKVMSVGLRFGVFDHIEPVPALRLDRIYRERLLQIERLDAAGFYAYHLAEHHTPAIHSLAPSQNVFLASVAQRTRRLRFGPCVYVLPLHHPLRLIEEISMLDNLSDGRLEIGVGRGGVMEAYFWGQEADSETNYARYLETLAILREGLSHDQLTYAGRFHSFEHLPMYLRPLQKPYPPLWYMRNPVTAAMEGMHTIIVGSLDGLKVAVPRYRAAWEEHQGSSTKTVQGQDPMIGLVVHLVIADTDEEALRIAQPAWEKYRWNLAA